MQPVPPGQSADSANGSATEGFTTQKWSHPCAPLPRVWPSWLNRIEAQFTALRYFALDGTDHATHKEQASMIRRYIIWRNNHAYDERLRRIVHRANVA
jgi:hypothetical protein